MEISFRAHTGFGAGLRVDLERIKDKDGVWKRMEGFLFQEPSYRNGSRAVIGFLFLQCPCQVGRGASPLWTGCSFHLGLFYPLPGSRVFLERTGWDKNNPEVLPRFHGAAIFAAGFIRESVGTRFKRIFRWGLRTRTLFPRQDQAAIFALKGEMKPADDFFTMTSEASWYYYLDKPCPTRFPYIWTAAPEEFQREIVQDLSLKKVKWVLFRDDDWSGWIDGISNEEKFPVVARFIRGNYHPFQSVEGREIWVLNGS